MSQGAEALKSSLKPSEDSSTTSTTQVPIDKVDSYGRRVWDKEYHGKRAQEKAEEEAAFPPIEKKEKFYPPLHERRPLQRRIEEVRLDTELGKTRIVTDQTPKMYQGGYWCSVCECLIKDSQAYLDHINGKKHNRMLGMTMKVEKISADKVREKLRHLHRKKIHQTEEKNKIGFDWDFENSDIRFQDSNKLKKGADDKAVSSENRVKKEKKKKRDKRKREHEDHPRHSKVANIIPEDSHNKDNRSWLHDPNKEVYYDHIGGQIGTFSQSNNTKKNTPVEFQFNLPKVESEEPPKELDEWTAEDTFEREQRILMGLPAGFTT